MTLREAVKQISRAPLCADQRVALLCSFEPLHLATFVQAYLSERFPHGAPEVRTFGYDQLSQGLEETASSLRHSAAFLFLSWEDVHPALSWRSRGSWGELEPAVVAAHGQELARKLSIWMERRGASESYVAVAPAEWLPPLDACAPAAWGALATAASAAIWDVTAGLSARGARIVRMPALALDFRGLLQAGCPLSAEASEIAAERFVSLAFPRTERKKVVVTDLDGTLWAGIIGEDGPQHLFHRNGQKDLPFQIFQKVLLKLKREGVYLAFCSKNNTADVVDVFNALEMPLRLEDFAAWRCNWEPKPDNLESIAKELNAGCDAMVFIDDNDAELAAVAARLPAVTVLKTPRESAQWQALFTTLQGLFAVWSVSAEDRLRTATISGNRKREAEAPARDAESGLTHLSGLGLKITVRSDAFGDTRSVELINRTNQFNLTGERITRADWLEWGATPGAFCLSARLEDKYGDFGTICVVTGRRLDPGTLFIRQFVLSCRAFGRGVESAVLRELVEWLPAVQVCGTFRDTGKNAPARRFLASLGCAPGSGSEWQLAGDSIRAHAESVLVQSRAIVRRVSPHKLEAIACEVQA